MRILFIFHKFQFFRRGYNVFANCSTEQIMMILAGIRPHSTND